MDSLLIKIFATGLTLSQVTTAPDDVKTHFDRVADQPQVVALLREGCTQMRKAFDIEDINVDDLIATAMDDPDAVSGGLVVFKGINFNDLLIAYRQFCKDEAVKDSPVDIAQVIDFYNSAVADLPDADRLKKLKLPGASVVLDGKGDRFAEVFESDQRRVYMPISEIPERVQKAFIAAEDKRFYEHKGIDERGLIRAFIGNLAQSGRPQGGSTITQQVVKNLLVGEDLTYERKIREMIVASRLERALTKSQILELYLNSTYLGRNSWGVEMASESYFGKSVKQLGVSEAAMLAALTKGPSYFNPDRHSARTQERLSYVLDRMQEDGVISAEEARAGHTALPKLVSYERSRRDTGYHFVDQLAREAKAVAGIDTLSADSYTVHSTIQPQLQRATEAALQEGLARYEIDAGRVKFEGAEANLADAVKRIQSEQQSTQGKPPWLQALESARLPLYDVHWPVAVVVERGKGDSIRVGLADGRIMSLSGAGAAQRTLKLYDVVFVRVAEAKGKASARAELRVRPQVQGAALILDNKTGRILAMAGGFSYPLSQLNRTSQSQRQPGSALKPVTYLAALQEGLQPNTLVRDEPITLPPIGGNRARDEDYWTPKNYEGGSSGVTTLRRALENSKNLATVNLLQGGIDSDPERSLDRICGLAVEAQIYKDCVRYYPFVLGAQPVRPIDLAAFYAAIANEGMRPAPYAIESVERNGLRVYTHQDASTPIASADHVAFYQLKTMMQGVVQRGTARMISSLAPYVAGKTGTTENENDAWFVGFTNEVTVAIWVGYDNADGRRRTLGGGVTGGSAAVPIFEPIIQAVWAGYAPRTALNPPSAEARQQLVSRTIDLSSGDPAGGKGFVEYFRRDGRGQPEDTQFRLVSREEAYSEQPSDNVYQDPYSRDFAAPGGYYRQQPQQPAPWGGLFRAPQQQYYDRRAAQQQQLQQQQLQQQQLQQQRLRQQQLQQQQQYSPFWQRY